MDKIELLPGKRYYYQQNPIRLLRILDMHHVIGEYEATGAMVHIPVSQLEPVPVEEVPIALPKDDILCISDKAWAKAQKKLEIIQPVLADPSNKELRIQTAEKNKVTVSTIYRWLHAYKQTLSVQSLVDMPNTGGKGQVRLAPRINEIIQQAIRSEYLTTQKKSAKKVFLEVQQQCRQAGLPTPGESTVRRRISELSEEEKVRLRWSKKMAKEQFEPLKGSLSGADFPLAVVQIDHTPVDIILVDEKYRQPLGRPYLTLATDVFSRMVVGFYLSFDPVGAISVGLCLTHSIFPKETWLSERKVQGDWPCWGVPSVLHLDNAKEFRGKMLERACEKYGMRLEYRPVKTPHWGGTVERLIRTFMEETHTLPGTTFSNVQDRKEYFSEKKAALTLPEFEQWFTTFIVNVYHRRIHKSLNTSPYERYREGILGSPGQPGTGLPARFHKELPLRLDFIPGEERTIQEYGVVMDHIQYYDNVLKPYIHSLEEGIGRNRAKRKFVFKRDPRNISHLYFLDPKSNQYHLIPYRNKEHPNMSIWEFRRALERAKLKGAENIDENAIFIAFEEMKEVALAAVERTRQVNKSTNRMIKDAPTEITSLLIPSDRAESEKQENFIHGISENNSSEEVREIPEERPLILPYDDIYDSAFD